MAGVMGCLARIAKIELDIRPDLRDAVLLRHDISDFLLECHYVEEESVLFNTKMFPSQTV